MSFWFFLTVLVAGNMALKAYKMRLLLQTRNNNNDDLKQEIEDLRQKLSRQNFDKRLEQLEETVFFGDFELKRQFKKLESEYKESTKG